jgi:hypothetical protein
VAQSTCSESDPQTAVRSLLDGGDILPVRDCGGRVQSEFTVSHRDQAAFTGADPQSRVAGLVQRFDGIKPDSAVVLGIEDFEAQSIEPSQTALGANPEKAVTRLKNGLHGVLRQTFRGSPGLVAVTLDGVKGLLLSAARDWAFRAKEEQREEPLGNSDGEPKGAHPA